jgi:hypothetical protein
MFVGSVAKHHSVHIGAIVSSFAMPLAIACFFAELLLQVPPFRRAWRAPFAFPACDVSQNPWPVARATPCVDAPKCLILGQKCGRFRG